MIPSDLRYTAEHEWVRVDEPNVITFGITDYAQDALGDVVFVSLPNVGAVVASGSSCGEVESTKSVSEIYAPVSGEIIARNDALETNPERINADPYDAGWIATVLVSNPADLESLLTADAYAALTGAV